METVKVGDYFNRTASEFDAIYTGRKSRLSALLDRLLRQDMYQRQARALKLCEPADGLRILDVGCGSGQFTVALAEKGARVLGVDVADNMLRLAERNARERKVQDRCSFLQRDVLELNSGRSFDVVLAIGFFDYVSDPRAYLSRMRRLTEDRLIATFPRLWTWRAPVRKVRLGLHGCPVYFYSRQRVAKLAQASGFQLASIERLGKLWFVVASPAGGAH